MKHLEIIKLLSDDKYTSGEYIGSILGISRAAVSKQIKKLKDSFGLKVISNTKTGYILEEKVDVIDIYNLNKSFDNIVYLDTVDSILSYSLSNYKTHGSKTIFISEYQTGGYGRFNRVWSSPFGQNIYCTLLEYVSSDISHLSGLSLVTSLAISDVLYTYGIDSSIKWPNDIMVDCKTISGVIINVVAEINGSTRIFIAFGINVNMTSNDSLGSDWTSMKLVGKTHMDRTKILTDVILKVREYMDDLQKHGFKYFRKRYLMKNLLSDCLFEVKVSNKHLTGCKFVDVSSHGEIILESNGDQYQFSTGDIILSAKL